MSKKTPIVAIVGRPNVGKSTLFNRLTESRTAIVDDISGVTRDRIYGTVEWSGKKFNLIDTGGYVVHSEDIFEKNIRKQVEFAIQEADAIIFLVDVRTGITDLDEEFSRVLKKIHKPVLVVVNKVDNYSMIHESHEFYKLGFDEIFTVSAINGSGTGEILDRIIDSVSTETQDNEEETDVPAFAILGRPNVGKSTFINSLLGEERNMVSDIPGTTRDAIHSYYKKFNKEFVIIDTAGLRKKKKVHEDIEYYSSVRTLRSIEEADVCFVMIDAHDGIASQDIKIIDLALSRKKGVVILINKWDAVEKDTKTHLDYEDNIKKKIRPLTDIPIIFISAKEKTRISKALDAGLKVFENRKKRIPTSELNETLIPYIENQPPPAIKGKLIKIKYITQVAAEIPTFIFFTNHPNYIKEPYKRYLENKIRQHFDFSGVPINIFFKKK